MHPFLRLLLAGLFSCGTASIPAANWPAWRGPTGDGICTETNLPVSWSRTHRVRWRVGLLEPGNSTPVVWGSKVFITQAIGSELWMCEGLNPLCYTSPIHADGVVVALGGFNGKALAVRAGGEGDVTSAQRLWHVPRTKQRIGSAVIHEGHVFIHTDPGIAECFELKTGKMIWEERLHGPGATGQNWSSVMLANGLCYTINQGGDCFVFKASPKFELVSVNALGERSNASIVPAYGHLFIRTHEALWCIGDESP